MCTNIPRIHHAWFHLYGTSRSARYASKVLVHSVIWTNSPETWSPMLYRLSHADFVESYISFKWPLYIHIVPIPMYTLALIREWWEYRTHQNNPPLMLPPSILASFFVLRNATCFWIPGMCKGLYLLNIYCDVRFS